MGKLIVAGVVIFALLQLVRPAIPTQPATAELQAPNEVKQVLALYIRRPPAKVCAPSLVIPPAPACRGACRGRIRFACGVNAGNDTAKWPWMRGPEGRSSNFSPARKSLCENWKRNSRSLHYATLRSG